MQSRFWPLYLQQVLLFYEIIHRFYPVHSIFKGQILNRPTNYDLPRTAKKLIYCPTAGPCLRALPSAFVLYSLICCQRDQE